MAVNVRRNMSVCVCVDVCILMAQKDMRGQTEDGHRACVFWVIYVSLGLWKKKKNFKK